MDYCAEKISKKKALKVIAHTSLEGYCCAAQMTLLSHALQKPLQMEFSDRLDKECDVSIGHEDAEVQSAEALYNIALQLKPELKSASIYPLISSLAKRKDVNNSHVQDAIQSGAISTKVGFNLHGSFRPLLSMIQNSVHPWFGGTRQAAKEIFAKAEVNPLIGEEEKTMQHLTDEEIGRLNEVLEPITGPLIGQTYELKHQEREFADAREFAMVLLACEAFGQHHTALGICLGDRRSRERAEPLLSKYRDQVKTFMEYQKKCQEDKSLLFLPIDDVQPGVARHYFHHFTSPSPLLISVRKDDRVLWLLKMEEHGELLTQIADQIKSKAQKVNDFSLCYLPEEDEGRLLEYAQNLLNRRSLEEPIA